VPPEPSLNATLQRRPRVLVVDDEPSVLAFLGVTLERAGYQVEARSSLQEGMATLMQSQFDLVLSDLYLGSDLAYRLAELASQCTPRVPVILLTGRPTFTGAAEALKSRVAEIVAKPVDPALLVNTCRRTVRDHVLRTRNEELEAQNRVLASVLPRAIEAKDPTTSGHAERVVNYADVLAQRCSVSELDRRELRLAALLHDVGKIGIPDAILCKPGALTQDEREVIQRHPQMGFEILAPLQEHKKVRTWVYQHHERWDGKGYPEGLAGEDVELPGRILILAEVYDALAEQRSYKPAWPVEKIVALFRQEAGKHFDPRLAHLVADGLEGMAGAFFATTANAGQ
jgi:putative two-component system response regulator